MRVEKCGEPPKRRFCILNKYEDRICGAKSKPKPQKEMFCMSFACDSGSR